MDISLVWWETNERIPELKNASKNTKTKTIFIFCMARSLNRGGGAVG